MGGEQLRVSEPRFTVKVTSAMPVSPEVSRPGLDGFVYAALQHLDRLVSDMRVSIGIPAGVWDERSAVQRYLAYLSVLVDVTLADMAMSALHSNDLLVEIKQRMLVEYAAKAKFFSDNPDYALYMTTIHEARSVLDKATKSGEPQETIDRLKADLEQKVESFSAVAHLKKKSFEQIMNVLAGPGEYVALYAFPSALMHGDPEGMRQLFEANEQGEQSLSLHFPDELINAMMVDAGANTVMFCEAFIKAYHPGDEALQKRVEELNLVFKSLVLKHPYKRDEDALADIQNELREAGYESQP